ncbi:MAG: hypothetical protein L0H25_10310, partial [Micrococcales bacterium]|nr:hypothetical protein [Micrococcales bacterium]
PGPPPPPAAPGPPLVAAPARVGAAPAQLVGADCGARDRGWRTLGFQRCAIPVAPEPTIVLGASRDDARRATDGRWVLVVDDERHPLGWVEPDRIQAAVTAEGLHRGGTVASELDSLRQYLDAALSSPSGRGVIVDGDGVLLGTVRPSEVIVVIEAIGPSASTGEKAGEAVGVRVEPSDASPADREG